MRNRTHFVRNLSATLDKVASTLEKNHQALGVSRRVASDMAKRCDMLSDRIERVAGINRSAYMADPNYPMTGDTFDSDEIGEEVPGAEEFDADEYYMEDNFTQQENRELRELQEDGLLPDGVLEERGPTPGVQVQASLRSLSRLQSQFAKAASQGHISPRKFRAAKEAIRLANTVLKSVVDEEADEE